MTRTNTRSTSKNRRCLATGHLLMGKKMSRHLQRIVKAYTPKHKQSEAHIWPRDKKAASYSRRVLLASALAICAMPFALAQRNTTRLRVAKVGSSADKGLAEVGDAFPVSIIVVTNTNDNGPGSLRNALAIANDSDTIDATGVSGSILLTVANFRLSRRDHQRPWCWKSGGQRRRHFPRV